MSYCNLTPYDWISIGKTEMIPLERVNNCWPWEHLTPDEWLSINRQLVNVANSVNYQETGAPIIELCFGSIGIVGSLLSAIALWRRSFVRKERFYRWMFTISVIDFFYNLLLVSYALGNGSRFPNLRSYRYFNTKILSTLEGIFGACSVASDLCTLFLTIERLWVLWKRTEKNIRKLFTLIEILIIIALAGACCLVFEAQYKVIKIGNDTDGFTKYSWDFNDDVIQSKWWNALVLVSCTISPCLLLFSMIFLSIEIGIIAFKRRKSPIFENASTQQQQEIRKQSSAVIKLCFALSFLYVLCQVGYCVSAIATVMDNQHDYKFTSTYFDLEYILRTIHFSLISNTLMAAFECFSKSMNFFIYFLCTVSFREELKDNIRRIFIVPFKSDCSLNF